MAPFELPEDPVLVTAKFSDSTILTITFARNLPHKDYIELLIEVTPRGPQLHTFIFAKQPMATAEVRELPAACAAFPQETDEIRFGEERHTVTECVETLQTVISQVCNHASKAHREIIDRLVITTSSSLPPNKPLNSNTIRSGGPIEFPLENVFSRHIDCSDLHLNISNLLGFSRNNEPTATVLGAVDTRTLDGFLTRDRYAQEGSGALPIAQRAAIRSPSTPVAMIFDSTILRSHGETCDQTA